METITIEVWLYGPLARYGGSDDNISALVHVELPAGSTVRDLLAHLEMPTEARGITFINGSLSAMPGLPADLDHALADRDRVALFHERSMWPFQYRHGVAMIEEMATQLNARPDAGLRSRYDRKTED